MNVQTPIRLPKPVKLTVDDFITLKRAGVFAGFSKSELIEGELSGVPLQRDDEPESDRSVPIKLRVTDYLLLDSVGAFSAYNKTELIDGVVYAMSPQHRPHGFLKDELAYALRRKLEALSSALHVATEQSVVIEPHSEPQPDIILTSEPRGPGAIPAESVTLIVEISASTARFDLGAKAKLYASAGIDEYWVVDIDAGVIHQMWAPEGEHYVGYQTVALGNSIAAVTIDGLQVGTPRL